jgi:hypothetical protein
MGLEKHMYASIGRAIMRRPAVPSGAKGFRYDSPTLLILVVFVFVSAIELVAIDLIVQRWPPVRVAFLVLGAWGLVWMVGLLCAHVLRPHTVGPDGMRVRDGLDLDVGICWDDVHSVAARRHVYDAKPPRVIDGDDSRTLVVAVCNETNLEIQLEKATSIRLPGGPPNGGERDVTALRLWADDPRAYLAEVKKHL